MKCFNKMSARMSSSMLWIMTLAVALDAQSRPRTDQNTSGSQAPTMPTAAESYSVSVEISILDKNYSISLDEYMDYKGNRALMSIYKGGNIENLIFSYATNEVFDISNQNCKVYTVDNTPWNLLYNQFANNKSDSDKRLNFGSASALRYAANSQSVYTGTTSVRGIPADIWSTSFTWSNNQGNMTALYYFSQRGWNMSSQLSQVPLRINVKGVSSGVAGTTIQNNTIIHRMYDFINYLPYVDIEPSLFSTPPEQICLNRKLTKEPPTFSPYFKYKAEIIDPSDSYITHYAIWYDQDYKVLREDTRSMLTQEGGTSDTVTEIHDFNTGVRYIMDHQAGCTVKPIDVSDDNSDHDVVRFQFNGSLIVDIRDPNGFFFLNSNYTYIGQRTIRGISCDVFSAVIPGYEVSSVKVDASFEYAFLAGNWSYLLLNGLETNVQNYPVQLVISAPSVTYTRVYNFFEFAEDHVTYPTYDVSSCFDVKQKLGFQLTFSGSFSSDTREQWTANVYSVLIETMQISPIRVGGITVTSDDDNIYISAYILSSASSAQFERNNVSLEQENDQLIKGVTMPDECAALCVTNAGFTCEGFQYCPDDGYACRLSTSHSPTKGRTRNATECDNFARTVKIGVKREPLLKEAYNSLEDAVYQGNVQVTIRNSDGTVPVVFTALDVDLISGKIVQNKPLPTLPSFFFYRLETAVSTSSRVEETYVWYDEDMGLVRYDNRDPTSDTPVSKTHIHDFNLGVAYEINQVTKECKVSPLASSEVFDVTAGTTTRNGGLVLSMKSPSALFFLDKTYTYVGQGTARGIMCDVFESRRNDFDLDHFNMSNQNTVFKYYFQADDWDYMSPEATASTRSQPIQLNVEDQSNGGLLTYNFYDFTEQHYTSTFYDASSCYSSDERKSFVIAFNNQPYHPVLDEVSSTFLITTIMRLAEVTFTSPIQFQSASITYDDYGVYVIATALGQTSPMNLFSSVMKVAHNSTALQIFTLSAEDCSAACAQTTTYICNSFDYCQDVADSNCLLGITHSESEGDPINSAGACTHYSRTENGSYPGMSIEKMYQTITDYIYDDKFQITITLFNGTSVSYLATSIRDDIILPNDPGSASGSLLQKFIITSESQFNKSLIVEVHNMISLTDCAMMCLKENTFNCQAFDYQFSVSTCRLSRIHPDELSLKNAITRNRFTSIYSRLYTADYTKYNAEVFGTHPAKTISNIRSAELCARACTDNSDFTCESFEICNDDSCRLRKTHILEARPADLKQNPDCIHYSRQHLSDYILRENRVIEGHDNVGVIVNNASECAMLCATGTGLPHCASFELCPKKMGEMTCTLSVADPTTQNNLIIVNSFQCSLYTKANSESGGTSTTVSPTSATSASVASTTGTNPTMSKTGSTSASVASTTATRSSDAFTRGNECVGKLESFSDTGPRIGIAFGTLVLGLLVGTVCMFMFLKFRFGRLGKQDDATMLRTYDK